MNGGEILVADIGGTNARFAVAAREGQGYRLRDARRLSAEAFAEFDSALHAYLADCGAKPARACFAVAGPVQGGMAHLTNSPWRLQCERIIERFGFAQVTLINDFAGQARGAPMLAPSERTIIAHGAAESGAPIVVLGPGTGLGAAVLAPVGERFHVLPTEGGHTAFAPQTDVELRVQAQLQRRFGYVSYERVCSGIGLEAVYQALADLAGQPGRGLDAVAIARARETDDLARVTFEIFFSALGVFAGNMVLASGGRGGLFLGGGILPKNQEALKASDFLRRFRERGPMSDYMRTTPIWLALSDDTALLGAAALADEAPTTE